MFTLAHRDGRIHNLPFFPMLPEAKPRQGTLFQEKYAELLAELPDYLQPVTMIGHSTGMRLGEILNLRWSNIQWIDHIIRLEDSKNGEAREIPFAGELERMLRKQYDRRQPGCDRVCFRIDPCGHARPIRDFCKVWRRVCVELGLGKWRSQTDAAGNLIYAPPRYAHSLPKEKMVYTGLIFMSCAGRLSPTQSMPAHRGTR